MASAAISSSSTSTPSLSSAKQQASINTCGGTELLSPPMLEAASPPSHTVAPPPSSAPQLRPRPPNRAATTTNGICDTKRAVDIANHNIHWLTTLTNRRIIPFSMDVPVVLNRKEAFIYWNYNDSLEVKRVSDAVGFGVYAKKAYPAGSILYFLGCYISRGSSGDAKTIKQLLQPLDQRYVVMLGTHSARSIALAAPPAHANNGHGAWQPSYINRASHNQLNNTLLTAATPVSCKTNASEPVLALVFTRDVAPGEQLLHPYNDDATNIYEPGGLPFADLPSKALNSAVYRYFHHVIQTLYGTNGTDDPILPYINQFPRKLEEYGDTGESIEEIQAMFGKAKVWLANDTKKRAQDAVDEAHRVFMTAIHDLVPSPTSSASSSSSVAAAVLPSPTSSASLITVAVLPSTSSSHSRVQHIDPAAANEIIVKQEQLNDRGCRTPRTHVTRKGSGRGTVIKESPGNVDWEVEAILDSKVFRGKVQYKVKWLGYDIADASWEPEANLKVTTITEDRYTCTYVLTALQCITIVIDIE